MKQARFCLTAGLVACALVGCDPEVPATIVYNLNIGAPIDARGQPTIPAVEWTRQQEWIRELKGWDVVARGQVVGKLEEANGYMRLEFERPSTDRPTMVADGLRLRADTPCGERTIPLTALDIDADDDTDEHIAGLEGRILLSVHLLLAGRPTLRAFVDWGQGSPREVRVGDVQLESGVSNQAVPTLGCQGPLTVQLGASALGTVPSDAPAFFVNLDEEVCHHWSDVMYGGGRSGLQQWSGRAVRPLERAPDYFLEPAPDTITVSVGDPTSRVELVRAPCPSSD